MKNHLNEIKWSFIYYFLSFSLTFIIIWINKEQFLFIILNHINWNKHPIIVTNHFEILITYLKMSFMLTLLITVLSSLIILILLFIKPGLYHKEWLFLRNQILKLELLLIVIHLLLIPFICNYFREIDSSNITFQTDYSENGQNLYENNPTIQFLGKMSELLINLNQIWILVMICSFLIIMMKINIIRKFYIKNRKWIWLIWYLMISLITPPDITLTILIITPIIILWESICLWESLREVHNQ